MAPGLAGGQAQAVRESQVGSEVSRQSEIVNRIETLTKQLDQRLTPILRDIPPRPANKEASDKLTLVGLATALSNRNDQLEAVANFLDEIISRLEL